MNNNLQKKAKEIPAEVLEIFFSEKTVSQISEICLKNGIKDGEKIKEIAKQIGLVLLGKLSSSNLSKTLQEKLRLEKNIAENIYFEANRVIFSQIKKKKPIKTEIKEKPASVPLKSGTIIGKAKKDAYLETIE